MTNVKDFIVARIDELEMRASTYRVARRLLDRAHEANGLVVVNYDEALRICDTESQETVRDSWPSWRRWGSSPTGATRRSTCTGTGGRRRWRCATLARKVSI